MQRERQSFFDFEKIEKREEGVELKLKPFDYN